MNRKPLLAILAILLSIIIVFLIKTRSPQSAPNSFDRQNRETPSSPADNPNRKQEFDRRVSPLIYTKHARCRMACRHIDEREVEEILEKGRINYQKSDPSSRPDPKYALEGVTRDNQEVRIIFAPADRGMVVITVIDLEKEWSCDCK